MKLKISSFTTDGADSIIRAIKYAYPHKTRQRCIVHIERECLSWLTQHPKSSGGILLRRLVCQISHIKTNNDKLFWIKELNKWYEDYEEYLSQKTVNKETGEITYTHDSLRRAYIHLHRALPNMFKYIDDPGIPNNTNSLESFFGHLKDNLRIHRGLSLQHSLNGTLTLKTKRKSWRGDAAVMLDLRRLRLAAAGSSPQGLSSRRPSPTTFVRVTNRFCPHYRKVRKCTHTTGAVNA
jgi:hypothetical protein